MIQLRGTVPGELRLYMDRTLVAIGTQTIPMIERAWTLVVKTGQSSLHDWQGRDIIYDPASRSYTDVKTGQKYSLATAT